MGIENALRRRDLTINSMAINLHNFEFIDPFNGINDLKKGVLLECTRIFLHKTL